jgi:hypothetical protein
MRLGEHLLYHALDVLALEGVDTLEWPPAAAVGDAHDLFQSSLKVEYL